MNYASIKQDYKQKEPIELRGFELVKQDSKTITICGDKYNIKTEEVK